MSIAIWIKLGFIIVGIVLMITAFFSHARKKMTVNLAVVWELLGLASILIGVVPGLSRWCSSLGHGTAIAMFVIGCLMLSGAFRICVLISSLIMKNQELAMQVSLLNQENEKILNALRELSGKDIRNL